MVYIGVNDYHKTRTYLFNIYILYIKRLELFIQPIKLYYDGYNDNTYNKLLNINKMLMEYINMHYYDKTKYIIDTSASLAELSQHTIVKKYNDKLLIYGLSNQAVCKIPNSSSLEIIPYSCKTSKFKALDGDDKFITLGIDNVVKKINQQQLTLLRRILQITSSITKNDWLQLEAIRKHNEKNVKNSESIKSLYITNTKGINKNET